LKSEQNQRVRRRIHESPPSAEDVRPSAEPWVRPLLARYVVRQSGMRMRFVERPTVVPVGTLLKKMPSTQVQSGPTTPMGRIAPEWALHPASPFPTRASTRPFLEATFLALVLDVTASRVATPSIGDVVL